MAYRRTRGLSGWGLAALSPAPSNIQSVLSTASQTSGVPLNILQAVAYQESRYNPAAVSPAGAQGLLQLMPATGASLGVTNPFDPQQNANAGASYLASLYRQYGNWNDALVAYNEGPGNFAKSGVFASSQSYADAILANAGVDSSLSPSLDTSGASAIDSSASGGLDFSSLIDFSAVSSSSPLLWVGIGLGVLGLAWAVSR